MSYCTVLVHNVTKYYLMSAFWFFPSASLHLPSKVNVLTLSVQGLNFALLFYADENTGHPLINSLVMFLTGGYALDPAERFEVGFMKESTKKLLEADSSHTHQPTLWGMADIKATNDFAIRFSKDSIRTSHDSNTSPDKIVAFLPKRTLGKPGNSIKGTSLLATASLVIS